jgi:hypothetical protein
MANPKVFSQSNVTGNPFLWLPSGSIFKKELSAGNLDYAYGVVCNDVNDFITTYMTKRVWITESGIWLAPPYVQCAYVE